MQYILHVGEIAQSPKDENFIMSILYHDWRFLESLLNEEAVDVIPVGSHWKVRVSYRPQNASSHRYIFRLSQFGVYSEYEAWNILIICWLLNDGLYEYNDLTVTRFIQLTESQFQDMAANPNKLELGHYFAEGNHVEEALMLKGPKTATYATRLVCQLRFQPLILHIDEGGFDFDPTEDGWKLPYELMGASGQEKRLDVWKFNANQFYTPSFHRTLERLADLYMFDGFDFAIGGALGMYLVNPKKVISNILVSCVFVTEPWDRLLIDYYNEPDSFWESGHNLLIRSPPCGRNCSE
jgi:hypothetical protein